MSIIDPALAAQVAETGVPVSAELAPLSAARLAEIRSLDLLSMMDDRAAPVVSGHLAVLLDEVDRLRARVAELEARDAALLTVMHRVRNMDPSVTDSRGMPTAPGCSVWGLLSDLATVRGLNRAPENNQWAGDGQPPDGITRRVAPTQALREDPHDGPLAHRYRIPRDLPEIGGRS
ncbi:hypothetical protein [Streptomyces sp. NPDC088736]|uniref:hypothetical protein n=1 Tax=Streptomyces sp. NPDC088736 TaxID=3365881 RepID=UPI00380475AF